MLQTVLDPLRNLDLALAREELDRSHFAHVHAHRVGGAAEFGVDRGKRRFRFLLRVFVRYASRRALGNEQRVRIRRLVVDLDAHVVERRDDGLDLLGIHHVVGQVVVDLGVREEAAFLSELDEVLQASAAGFSVLGPGFRAQQQRAFGVAVAARPAGLAQLQEFLCLKLELGLELLFLLLGEERRFLRPCLLQRCELLGFRLLARGELLRLGFFARHALALPLLFLGGLEARLFLCRALARP